MGLLDRLRHRKPGAEEPPAQLPPPGAGAAGTFRERTVSVTARLYGGDETLEVVGESYRQEALWRIVGAPPGSRVRHPVNAVLYPETANSHDPNAISIQIDGHLVGYLAREDAAAYRPGLLALMEKEGGSYIALEGVVIGGRHGTGSLGVFLDHDPEDFGLSTAGPPPVFRGDMRTGFSEAWLADADDDDYDLSWYYELPDGDRAGTTKLRELLASDPDPGSRGSNNFFAVGEYALDGYTAIDEAALFASPDVFVLTDGLELPTDLVGFRGSQVELPEDATIEAIARATGIDLPVVRHDDLPDRPDFDPPEDFAYWSVFDTSKGRGLEAIRTGVGGVLPVQFSFSGPAVIVDGFYGYVGDSGPLCEFTEVPDPAGSRNDCDGDYAIEVDTVRLPNVEAAEAVAARVVDATESGVDEFAFKTTVTEERPYPEVVVSVKPASPTVPLNWYFSFGADGQLAHAQGNVGTLDEIVNIPLIDLDAAVARLNDPAFRWLAPAGLDSADAPRPAEPSGRTIEIVAIEADLWEASSPVPYLSANYGLSYYLPAYAFIDVDGMRHLVPAVVDDVLLLPADG
jgi:hypothetical protein